MHLIIYVSFNCNICMLSERLNFCKKEKIIVRRIKIVARINTYYKL